MSVGGRVHERVVEIRWRDMDAFGHVNNAVFLTYLEALRDEFMARLCGNDEDMNRFVVRRVEIDFLSQLAQADGAVRGEVELERIGSSSVTLQERLFASSDGRRAAEARTVVVHLDATRLRSEPIPADLRARIEANAGR